MSYKSVLMFFVICVIIACASHSAADVGPGDISAALIKNLTHPYLYFTESEKAGILGRIESDPELNDIFRQLLAEGNRLLYTPVETVAPREPKHPRYDSDNKAVNYVNSHRRASLKLAFLYQMTGEEKYAQKAFEFADTLCDLKSWVYRAHEFPIIYSRVWPWNVPDDRVVFTYDIRTGDMAYELATVYDWLYPALNKRQRDRIRSGLLENAITRVRGNFDYHWWATSYRCNWCGICIAGLGVSSLALMNEDPQLAEVVAECYNRMEKHLGELGVDGGWQEGRSYWAYGMRSSVHFMDTIKRLTGGKLDLFRHPRVRNNPAAFALYGLTGYFGDGSGGVVGHTYLLNKLVDETKDGEAAWYRNTMLGRGRDIYDIIWPRSDVEPVAPKDRSKHFRTIDWAFMRSDFQNPETVTIATKAGLNDDPHHGHLDVGQVILNWRGQAFLQDLGSGSYFYDEKYFDEIRWEYPQASSAGHNVVFVNGELQISAKYKDKPWREGVGGEILEFRPGDRRDYTLLDGTNAYPGRELKKWRRHIVLDKPVVTLILDEVSCDRGDEIEVRFHSECTPEFKGDHVLLQGEKGAMALIPAVEGGFDVRPGKHPYLPVRKTARFQWIPYFGTVFDAPADDNLAATVILPVDDDGEAAAVTKSVRTTVDSAGNVTISFQADGTTYRYRFVKQPDGLVLE